MTGTRGWIRRQFEPYVKAGVGKWAAEKSSELGRGIYQYEEAGLLVRLYERGILYARGLEKNVLPYDAIRRVDPLPLTAVMSANKKPDSFVTLRLVTEERNVSLDVPMKIYSQLFPTLHRIASELA